MERDNEVKPLRIVSGGPGYGFGDERQGTVVGRDGGADDQGRRQTRAGGLGFRSRRAAEGHRPAGGAGDDGGPCRRAGGGPDARIKGVFAAPVTWPLIPLHTVLLPDGG